MPSLSILVVDDVLAFAELLAQGLRGLGHTTTCAGDGREAAALLIQQRFDVVVTDIIMPVGDGFELIDAVKRVQPDARIIAMSGGGKLYSAGAVLDAAQQNGVDAILQKPFGPQALSEALDRVLETRPR